MITHFKIINMNFEELLTNSLNVDDHTTYIDSCHFFAFGTAHTTNHDGMDYNTVVTSSVIMNGSIREYKPIQVLTNSIEYHDHCKIPLHTKFVKISNGKMYELVRTNTNGRIVGLRNLSNDNTKYVCYSDLVEDYAIQKDKEYSLYSLCDNGLYYESILDAVVAHKNKGSTTFDNLYRLDLQVNKKIIVDDPLTIRATNIIMALVELGTSTSYINLETIYDMAKHYSFIVVTDTKPNDNIGTVVHVGDKFIIGYDEIVYVDLLILSTLTAKNRYLVL